ncbi:MAG: hypothetical protein S4CHLAM20_13990 [Chlamydiia bacterium]|nr:hypothetical protein [Chlamydiia bacterium]
MEALSTISPEKYLYTSVVRLYEQVPISVATKKLKIWKEKIKKAYAIPINTIDVDRVIVQWNKTLREYNVILGVFETSRQVVSKSSKSMENLRTLIGRMKVLNILAVRKYEYADKRYCGRTSTWCMGRAASLLDGLMGALTGGVFIADTAIGGADLTQFGNETTIETTNTLGLGVLDYLKLGCLIGLVTTSRVRDWAYEHAAKLLESYTKLGDIVAKDESLKTIAEAETNYKLLLDRQSINNYVVRSSEESTSPDELETPDVLTQCKEDKELDCCSKIRKNPLDSVTKDYLLKLDEEFSVLRELANASTDKCLEFFARRNVHSLEEIEVELQLMNKYERDLRVLTQKILRLPLYVCSDLGKRKNIRKGVLIGIEVVTGVIAGCDAYQEASGLDNFYFEISLLAGYSVLVVFSRGSDFFHMSEARNLVKEKEIKRLRGFRRYERGLRHTIRYLNERLQLIKASDLRKKTVHFFHVVNSLLDAEPYSNIDPRQALLDLSLSNEGEVVCSQDLERMLDAEFRASPPLKGKSEKAKQEAQQTAEKVSSCLAKVRKGLLNQASRKGIRNPRDLQSTRFRMYIKRKSSKGFRERVESDGSHQAVHSRMQAPREEKIEVPHQLIYNLGYDEGEASTSEFILSSDEEKEDDLEEVHAVTPGSLVGIELTEVTAK